MGVRERKDLNFARELAGWGQEDENGGKEHGTCWGGWKSTKMRKRRRMERAGESAGDASTWSGGGGLGHRRGGNLAVGASGWRDE